MWTADEKKVLAGLVERVTLTMRDVVPGFDISGVSDQVSAHAP